MSEWYWQTLGLDATDDERAIKRAYAKQLKVTRPEDNPEQFQQLRQAYEIALHVATHLRQQGTDEADDAAAQQEVPAQPDSAKLQDAAQAATPTTAPPTEPASEAAPHASLPAESAAPAPPAPDRLPLKPISYPPLPDWPNSAPMASSEQSPAEIAERLWQQLEQVPLGQFADQLKHMLAGEALFSLPVRDAFELRACAYCTQDDAELPVINCLFDAFDWQHDMAYLAKINRQLAEAARNRHYHLNLLRHAEQLWLGLFQHGTQGARAALNDLQKSHALNHYHLRAAFALHASQYCRGDNSDPELVAALIEVLDWENGPDDLAPEQRQAIEQIVARHREAEGFAELQRLAKTNPALRLLLGNKKPGPSWTIWDRYTVKQLQHWIGVIDERYPTVREQRLNLPVFQAWCDLARGKRYFLQTFLFSLLLGLPCAALWAALPSAMPSLPELPPSTALWLGELTGVVLVAWYTLKPPEKTLAYLRHLRDGVLHKPLTVYRFDRKLHLAAVLGFAVVSLSLGIHLKPWQQNLQTVAFALCLLALIYTASADLSWPSLLLAPAAGVALSPMLHDPLASPHSLHSLMLFFTSLTILLQRSPMLYLRWRDEGSLNKARIAWAIELIIWFVLGVNAPAHAILLRFQHPGMLLWGWAIALHGLQIVDVRMQSQDTVIIFLRAIFIAMFSFTAILEQPHLIARCLSGLLLFLFAMIVINIASVHVRGQMKS